MSNYAKNTTSNAMNANNKLDFKGQSVSLLTFINCLLQVLPRATLERTQFTKVIS